MAAYGEGTLQGRIFALFALPRSDPRIENVARIVDQLSASRSRDLIVEWEAKTRQLVALEARMLSLFAEQYAAKLRANLAACTSALVPLVPLSPFTASCFPRHATSTESLIYTW